MRTTQAQLKASKKWKHRNKLVNRKNCYKSTCKNYILHWCKSAKELEQVRKWYMDKVAQINH